VACPWVGSLHEGRRSIAAAVSPFSLRVEPEGLSRASANEKPDKSCVTGYIARESR
jgi:hypothetical protein